MEMVICTLKKLTLPPHIIIWLVIFIERAQRESNDTACKREYVCRGLLLVTTTLPLYTATIPIFPITQKCYRVHALRGDRGISIVKGLWLFALQSVSPRGIHTKTQTILDYQVATLGAHCIFQQ